MSAIIIDGKAAAADIKSKIKNQVSELVQKGFSPPGLATVLVGDDPASHSYVKAKHRACEQLGITSFSHILAEDSSQEEVETLVGELAADPLVHGILVQLPLPDDLDEEEILNKIPLGKDVDGFHPVNIGRLAQKGRAPLFTPCTPTGIVHLLKEQVGSLEGRRR